MDSTQEGVYRGRRFRRLVTVIQLILRAFSVTKRLAIHPTWNKSALIPLRTTLPSPTRHKHSKPDLQQLTQPGAMQALTNRIHQRLQLQSSIADMSSSSEACETGKEDPLPGDVQRVLTNSSWTRSHKDLALVYSKLQSYEVFSDYPPHTQKQLCKVGWYQKVEPGRILFRQGQQASCFYLILSGSVRVLVRAGGSASGGGGYDEVQDTLKSGQCFGDIAISKQLLRASTCVASKTAEFLVISKSDYADLSLRQSRLSYQRAKHFAFCKTISLLKYFPLDVLRNQPDLCLVKYFKLNAVVVKDSKKCDWVYVIMTGSCRVVKRFINSNEFGRSSMPSLGAHTKKVVVFESGLAAGHRSRTLAGGMATKSGHAGNEDSSDSQVQGHRLRHTSLQEASDVGHPMRKQFLVQLQILHPKDIFGLSSILHNSEPSITLVSNGADVVMISKDFLMGCMSEVVKVKLQRKVMQYPSEEAMRKRIRDHNKWKSFKHSMVHQVKSRRVH